MGRPHSLTSEQQKEATKRRAQGAIVCGNWPTATTAAFRPCAVLRALHERDRFSVKRRWFKGASDGFGSLAAFGRGYDALNIQPHGMGCSGRRCPAADRDASAD